MKAPLIVFNGLPPAPADVLGPDGQPCFGRFAGAADRVDWSGLAAPYARSRVWRHFHHKRWQYVALSTEELFCGIAIVDLGWANSAFAYAFDRVRHTEVAAYSQNGLPGLTASIGERPAGGAASHFRFLNNRIGYRQLAGSERYQLSLRCGHFEIDAGFDAAGAAPLLLAVGSVDGGSAHATQKSSGMPLTGQVRVRGRSYDLQGGVASFDYSNGLLARETAWRRAAAHDLQLGFNLQDGYFGDQENALWLDGELFPLGNAKFDFKPNDPLAAWHIRTDDGLLDLQFEPEGVRREDRNWLLAGSRYMQPIGCFNGWVKPSRQAPPRLVRRLVGVTQDCDLCW